MWAAHSWLIFNQKTVFKHIKLESFVDEKEGIQLQPHKSSSHCWNYILSF